MPEFLIRKKLIALGDDFWVEDSEGEKVFRVDGKVMRLRDTFVIETPDGDELLKVQERKLPVRSTMVIERQGEELATVQKRLLTPLRDKFKIELANGGELEATGDLLDHEFTIEWASGERLAEVSKKWFSVRDTYGVSVADGQDPVFALAIALCIDAMERG